MRTFISSIILYVACCNPLMATQRTLEESTVPRERRTTTNSNLLFHDFAKSWDEGMPLGNAVIGALVWQKGEMLRLSLDRADLWDLRPVDSLSGANYRFRWVKEQVRKGDYLPVQKKFDWPYDNFAAPSKIPGAALEFDTKSFGAVRSVCLDVKEALCTVNWANGIRLQTFVHATAPVGWFVFDHLEMEVTPELIIPEYVKQGASVDGGPVEGLDLRRLGYPKGLVERTAKSIRYHQPGWGNFSYDVCIRWERKGHKLYGVWSITSTQGKEDASILTQQAMKRGCKADQKAHRTFWHKYGAQSSISLPDTLLQQQYDREMYKFGSATREHSYPISLQSVWTADNGKLPPWKGDYHHDLNTQLSYWPTYTGNHLTEGLGYLNTLWAQRDTYKKYTRQYFEVEGLNVPGVCSLTGEPMGGWIQYAMSQTVSAWLSQHFYLHWRYTADSTFLRQRAYPFTRDVATFLENISSVDSCGIRRLEMSSSPEINDNDIRAWFSEMTNYDLSLMQFAFASAAQMADSLGLKTEARHWRKMRNQLPELSIDNEGCLQFAPGYDYRSSHRHFSHAMAIYPLSLIDPSQGASSQRIIQATIKRLKEGKPDYWVGYSYAWLGNLQARARDGDGAAETLRTFARCFCLKNTFHVNGDQTKSGKSLFTYRPFTLEGNFAFASGVQQMLLQSHTDTLRLFPAIPAHWSDVSFRQLRAEGAFVVSAVQREKRLEKVSIFSEQGGILRLALPSNEVPLVVKGIKNPYVLKRNLFTVVMRKGETLHLQF